ncbi:MAG: hypothetical protein ACJARM_000462 [Glaciecola sp.]|jgi:hypothetical protein
MSKHEFNRSYQKLKTHIREYVRKKNLSNEDFKDSSLKDNLGFFRLLNNSSNHLNKENVHALLEWYIKFDKIEFNSRSKDSQFYITAIFEDLLERRIRIAGPNDKFILNLLSGIQSNEKSKPISKYILRYKRLNSVQRSTIFGKLEDKYKGYQNFSLLSQLEALYRRKSKSSFIPAENRKVRILDLINHDFAPNKILFDTFNVHAKKLKTSFKNNNWESMLGEIDSFNLFINMQSANVKLQIFIWAWRNITDKEGYNSIGTFTIQVNKSSVKAAIYWLCFYHAVLGLRRGRQVSIDNIIGERDEKEVLKVNDKFKLSSNHLFRYIGFREEYSTDEIKKGSAFIEDIKLNLYSQIYARTLGFTMLTAEKQYYFALKVQNTNKQKKEMLSIGRLKAFTQTRHFGKENVSIGFGNAFTQPIQLGKRYGYFEVQGIFQPIQNKNQYLFYVCDVRHPYIIMVMDDKQMTAAINSTVYELVYMKTRGMMRLIAFYFEVLGYMPTFVSGGFLGLLKEVVIDIAADYLVENAVANMGISSAGEVFADILLKKKGINIGVRKLVDPTLRKTSNVRPPSGTKGKVINRLEPSAKSVETGITNKLTGPHHRLTMSADLSKSAQSAKIKIEDDLDILKTELNTSLDRGKVIQLEIKELDSKIKRIQVKINNKLGTKLSQPDVIKTISVNPHLVPYSDFEKLIKARDSFRLEGATAVARRNQLSKEIKGKVKDLKLALSNYYKTNPPILKPVSKLGDPDPIVYSINDPHIAKNIDDPQEWGTKLQALADKIPHVVELDKLGEDMFHVYDNVLPKRHFPHSGRGDRIVSNTTSQSSETLWSKYRKIFSRLDPELAGPKTKATKGPASGHTRDQRKIKEAIDRLVERKHLRQHNGSLTKRYDELLQRSALGVIEAPGNITAAEFKIFLRRKLTAPTGQPLLDHLASIDVGILDYVRTLKQSQPSISNQAIIDHLLDKVLRIAVY